MPALYSYIYLINKIQIFLLFTYYNVFKGYAIPPTKFLSITGLRNINY